MSNLAHLKEYILHHLDVGAFYERYLNGQRLQAVKGDGWSNRVLCPLHNDNNTPAFFVNLKTGSFKCQTCSGAGSVFDFWMLQNGLAVQKDNLAKALIGLADFAGVDISSFKNTKHYNPSEPLPSAKDDDYIPKMNRADTKDASEEPLPDSYAKEFHQKLTPDHYKYLSYKRGLTKTTIEQLQIGWDPSGKVKDKDSGQWINGRYTIPIRNKDGELRNIRMYSPRADGQYKMINFVRDKDMPNERGYGSPVRLFMLDQLLKLKWDHVVICEGEWDCILLNQYFLKNQFYTWGAVTGTHGANTFSADWVPYFFGKHVYFCFDCDEAGKTAAQNHATKFFAGPMKVGKFESVRIVELPLDGSKDTKDIGDYFLKADGTFERLIELFEKTPELIVGGFNNEEATVESTPVDSLVEAVKNREYIDKRITVPLTISGRTSRIYHAIREYTITACKYSDSAECCMNASPSRTIPYGNDLFIESCMERPVSVLKHICAIACDKQDNAKIKIKPTRKVVMEEYFAHQVIERWTAEEDEQGRMQNSQELTETSIYVLQPPDNMPIEPENYLATGWVRTHPKTSVATLFVQSLIPMEEDWKGFSVKKSETQELIRHVKENFTIEDILNEISQGVTRIYESDHILLTILLTYLSPLWFRFNGGRLRGWINSCIIGDSGTGKSDTYLRFSDWIGVGDLFSALSGTRTGLLYAIKQKAGDWHVSIGRYVQSSGKIIAIDETQETPTEEIKRMAIAMDQGWLQIEQVASGGYHTQTRTVFLMNPKLNGADATLSDFAYGCDALRQSFAPMFIRRLDIAVFGARKHRISFYNKKVSTGNQEGFQMQLTASMMRSLVYWAWTRNIDQVHWTPEATEQCLHEATRLSEIYGFTSAVPLVAPQDFRNNLARLSTAYAVLDRSFSEDLESVIVENRHVTAMSNFVDEVYRSPECSLRQRSKYERQTTELDNFEKISETFYNYITNPRANQHDSVGEKFLQLLILIRKVQVTRKRDLQDQLNVNQRWLNQQTAKLQSFDLIEFRRTGIKATNKFNKFMLQWESNGEISRRLEQARIHIGDETGLIDSGPEDRAFAYESESVPQYQFEDHYDEPHHQVDPDLAALESQSEMEQREKELENRVYKEDLFDDPF